MNNNIIIKYYALTCIFKLFLGYLNKSRIVFSFTYVANEMKDKLLFMHHFLKTYWKFDSLLFCLNRYMNGKELELNDRFISTSLLNQNVLDLSATITKLLLSDAGKLSVVAKNSEGQAVSSSKLNINGKNYSEILIIIITM